ncbi:uncharacterized protein CELE_F08B12.4 [Caenorhabditis elegans]|uniref:Secreted protein n=2 Tax=Caenorhabditis elegans TaxID=6239 RepID=H9G2R8_CAEEL|nr:Secreted protein [Caenorhabditis elegans]CCG28124.1 Secreted protein [Caenorhabditis elegans]|eukprot:NP_001257148.1 Uncharacterized protein CELE_F08B12.4 [Caenorhabditis elegans]
MNSFVILAIVLAIVNAMPVEQDGLTGGRGVPHPNSAAGQELTNKNLEEKSVLEGGTQVKPWLKNQPDLANIREQNHQ